LQYAKQLGNGAVFKRLGFMLERFAPQEKDAIARCLAALTKGNTKLDSKLPAEKLITRWRLWVPESWSKKK
jgi:predicted transcriptional regulator of viral defense system